MSWRIRAWSVSGANDGPSRYPPAVAAPYVHRLIDDALPDVLSTHAAVLLLGPRAAGKTTTARQYSASVVRLDRPAEAAAFAADPDAALARLTEPALLDEWQAVPEVLGAVKRAVDDDSRPGRFILTGSVRAELDSATWPGTGRLIRLVLHSLNVRELARATARLNPLDLLAGGDPMRLAGAEAALDLPAYVDLALRGPRIVARSVARSRRRSVVVAPSL